MDLPNRLDLYRIGRLYLRSRAQKIDPAVIDTLGSDANLFVGSQSFVAAAVVRQLAARAAALMLDGAHKEDLDRLVFDRYGFPRKGAAAALGAVTIARPTPAGGGGSVNTGSKVLAGAVEYITTTQATFGASTLSASANVRAVKAGKEYQVGANTIRAFAQQPFDPTLTVTNPLATAGGEPREPDAELRQRARDFPQAQRRGVLGAIELGARFVPGISSAVAIEALTPEPNPARAVTLYVADSSGVASDALCAVVRTSLLDWRAAGILVAVIGSTPQLISVSLHLSFLAGVDSVAIGEQVRAATIELVNALPVNGVLELTALNSLLQRFKSRGLLPLQGSILSPTGDLVPDPGKTLRVRPQDVVLV